MSCNYDMETLFLSLLSHIYQVASEAAESGTASTQYIQNFSERTRPPLLSLAGGSKWKNDMLKMDFRDD
jgi:hypothetical protein